MRVKPHHTRLVALAIATLFALPLSFGWASGLFLWTSPLLFLNSLISGKVASWFALFGVASLVLISLKKRWYCRWLCPVGLLCDAASKSPLKLMAWMPRLGMLLAVLILVAALFGLSSLGLLDPIAIFHSFFNGFQTASFSIMLLSVSGLVLVVGINLLSRHLWCTKLCPLGGLQDAIARINQIVLQKSNRYSNVDLARRATLGALGGFAVSMLIPKSSHASVIRPPGSLDDGDFQSTCIRCGSCAKSCPTDIIQLRFQAGDVMSLLTPKVSFSVGYCLPDCNACGAVCPSGAIRHFNKKDKKYIVMGSARIDIKNCLLAEHKECDRCQFYCDYDAITIRTSDVDFSARPDVDKSRCVGCGACVVVCPVRAIDIEPQEMS